MGNKLTHMLIFFLINDKHWSKFFISIKAFKLKNNKLGSLFEKENQYRASGLHATYNSTK